MSQILTCLTTGFVPETTKNYNGSVSSFSLFFKLFIFFVAKVNLKIKLNMHEMSIKTKVLIFIIMNSKLCIQNPSNVKGFLWQT